MALESGLEVGLCSGSILCCCLRRDVCEEREETCVLTHACGMCVMYVGRCTLLLLWLDVCIPPPGAHHRGGVVEVNTNWLPVGGAVPGHTHYVSVAYSLRQELVCSSGLVG